MPARPETDSAHPAYVAQDQQHEEAQKDERVHMQREDEVLHVVPFLPQVQQPQQVARPEAEPRARLGIAEVIDRRIERGRQLTCFAHDLSPFVRRLDQQLSGPFGLGGHEPGTYTEF